jgi:phosphoribosyl 1,2-cyclic phosphate phosphodiesterase
MISVVVLGSGTSTGVPSVACSCTTCTSDDPRDKRLRTSILIQSSSTSVVVDTSMDFRRQMLDHNVMDLDGVVFTHHHFDHIGGFDDIRPYNFRSGRPLPIFALRETVDVLQSTFPYAFGLIASTGAAVPSVDVNLIDTESFTIGDLSFTPIPLRHGTSLRVNGYRIGNFAYCTDVNFIPDSSWQLLEGLDVLILDGLRREPHPTHFTIDQALDVVNRLKPRRTWLTHIAHQLLHAEVDPTLPSSVALAYDGLRIYST